MTPKEFAEWAAVLRLDPFVALVLAYSVHVLRRQHKEAMALLREVRDAVYGVDSITRRK